MLFFFLGDAQPDTTVRAASACVLPEEPAFSSPWNFGYLKSCRHCLLPESPGFVKETSVLTFSALCVPGISKMSLWLQLACWLQFSLPVLCCSPGGLESCAKALPCITPGIETRLSLSTHYPRTWMSLGTSRSCFCSWEAGAVPHLCFPEARAPKPVGVLEAQSSLAVPRGSSLTFTVSKRPLRGFVIILRVLGATLT